MKRSLGLLAAFCALFFMGPLAAKDKCKKLFCELKKAEQCCNNVNAKQKCQYVIHAADITTTGFVIDKPGVWCLDGDIAFNPPPSAFLPPDPRAVQAAITIEAGLSDVTLILGDHTISQVGAGTIHQTPYVVGILVPDPLPSSTDPNAIGAQSIYIQGDQAIIDGFSMYGIRVFAHTYDIRIENVTVKNSAFLATLASRNLGTDAQYFPHSITPNPFGVGGIVIGESQGFGMGPQFFSTKADPQNRVSEVVLKNVSCLNNFFNGLMTVFSSNVTIDQCHIDDTYSDDPGSGGIVPVFPNHNALVPIGIKFGFNIGDDVTQPACFNIRMTDSTCNSTTFKGDFTTTLSGLILFSVQGVSDQWTRGIYCENCQFNSSTCTFVGSIAVNYGSARSEDTTYINCSFDGARGITGVEGLHRSGFSAPATKSSSNSTFINCTANDNQQIGNLQKPFPVLAAAVANGFHLDFAKNVTFINCTANDNIINGPGNVAVAGVPTASRTNAAGFAVSDATTLAGIPDAFSENFVFQNCVALRNMALNGGVAQGFQFIFTSNTNPNPQIIRSYVLDNCVASGNNSLVPGIGIPLWNSTTAYPIGAVVIDPSDNRVYTALIANTNMQPSLSPTVWQLGPSQGISCGFAVYQNPNLALLSWPISFTNCKALHNKGAERVANFTPSTNGFVYSAGFYMLNAQRHEMTGCEAVDNVYGIFLQQCDRCAIRRCRSDNNEIAGYTDIGQTGTPAAPTVSTSYFEANTAFTNDSGTQHTGTNGNYNVVLPSGFVPTLQGSLSALTNPYPLSTGFRPADNISMVR